MSCGGEGQPAGGPGTILLAALPLPAHPPPHIAWLVLVLLQTPQQTVLSGHKVIFPTASFPWRLRLPAQRPPWCLPHSGQCKQSGSGEEGAGQKKSMSLGVVRSYVSVGGDPLIIRLQDKTPQSTNIIHENIIHKLSRSQILLRKKCPDMRWFFQGFLIFEKFDPTIPFLKLFFIFDCARSALQRELFSSGERLLSARGVQASHCSALSCRAQPPGHVGSAAASSAPERWLNS